VAYGEITRTVQSFGRLVRTDSTGKLVLPLEPIAIALTVVVRSIENSPPYSFEVRVGSLPSVV